MSSQQCQEKLEQTVQENNRLRKENERLRVDNLDIAKRASTAADRCVESEERCDELALQLAASKMREGMLQSDLADALLRIRHLNYAAQAVAE